MRKELDLGDRKVTLVGTAHVSEESVNEVREAIEQLEPDLVGVELDEQRFESLRDRSGWKDLDISEAVRDGKGYLLLFNLLLSIYQRKLGIEQDMEPGQELLSAVSEAEGRGIEYALLDRDITETFRRAREELSLWEKFKLLAAFWMEEEEYDIEELKQVNILDQLVAELEHEFPSIKRVFLDERNSYMAGKLLEKEFDHAVVVVGAAHVDGIADMLENNVTEVKESTASTIPWMTMLKYGIPAAIIGMLGYSFYTKGLSTGLKASGFWILANGLMATAGAVAARSHPLTWIASFLSAPLTSLSPVIGAGMVAAYVEARFYPPTVEELEDIAYIQSYRELWQNQVGRILLTFILVSIGSSIATFISAGYIASIIGL